MVICVLRAGFGGLGCLSDCFEVMPGIPSKSMRLIGSCLSCADFLSGLCSPFEITFSSEICSGAASEMFVGSVPVKFAVLLFSSAPASDYFDAGDSC